MSGYISLHNHTMYSMMTSIIKPIDLINRASELGMKSIAVTDSCTFGGIWSSYKAAKKKGIKLLVGCQYNFSKQAWQVPFFKNGSDKTKPNINASTLILIAKNGNGYKNLLKLNLDSFEYKIDKKPLIDWTLLKKYSKDVICLTGDLTGMISQSIAYRNKETAYEDLTELKEIFENNLVIEMEPNNLHAGVLDQILSNRKLLELALKLNIRVVAASNARYLKKEQASALDMLMSISSGRSLKNRSRPKFEYPQLYLHTREDIVNFFKRNYSEEVGNKLCDTTIEIASECEIPDWIRPDVVTGDKSQLPIFNVKSEPDYNEFIKWNETLPENIKNIEDDKKYVRFVCEKNWSKISKNEDPLERNNKNRDFIPKSKNDEYLERYHKELEIYEKLGFSSYMLITADFLNWARNNEISIGPGRGCLVGNTRVLTNSGFKKLENIQINEKVYTHTGKLQQVTNIFSFDIKEELFKLKIENSFGDITLTKDHKIYGLKKNDLKFKDPYWIKSCDLSVGDYIYTKFPLNLNKDYTETFDLGRFSKKEDVFKDKIAIKRKISNAFSIRQVSKKTGLPFETIRGIKNNNTKYKTQKNINIISKYLFQKGTNFQAWLDMPKWDVYYVNRFVNLDDEFIYALGYWIGDGCLRYKQKNGINYVFNINEKVKANTIKTFYEKIGFNICEGTVNNCVKFDIGTSILSSLFKEIFPNYKNLSSTKHLPTFFRKFSNRQLKILINGLCDSDGHIRSNKFDTIKTISEQLICEIKECLDFLQIVSGVYEEGANINHNRNNSKSYVIRFSGIRTELEKRRIYKNGYYSKIRKIETSNENKVFDITVENDNSYLTSSGVVHNSVGGSLVAYLLNIHQADPIKYGLIFERFLNDEKEEPPDIDSDIDSDGREKVLSYVERRYGKTFVAHVSNFISFTPKIAITDVITSLEIGGSRKDAFRIAKNITETIPTEAKNVNDAIKGSKLFAEFVSEHPEVKEYADQLIGIVKSFATHAAGVVIGKYDLYGLVPLRFDDEGVLALEWEKTQTAENGLIKIDFLGLETLNIIKTTRDIIQALGKESPPNPPSCDIYYKNVYKLITEGNTFGVFQLGASGGTIGLCNAIDPKNLDDLAVITSLARPGVPVDIKKSYIERRFGREDVEIPHSNLKRAVEATMGYCIFEESFLWLAHDLCGWNLQKADKMRKISKLKAKGKHLLDELYEDFIKDSMKHSNVSAEFAKKIWDEWIIPLSGYAFNKSHAVLYSMTSLHTAYLKANYFNEFMTANLISETKSKSPAAKENILKIKHTLRKQGVIIAPPHINKSFENYRLINDHLLITGLSALHGIQEPAAVNILENRPFDSFEDLLYKTDGSKVRAPTIQALAAVGALDCFGHSRKSMALYCSDLRKKYAAWKNRKVVGKFEYELPKDEWTLEEIRALEAHFLGESISGTKKDSFKDLFSGHNAVSKIDDLKKMSGRTDVVLEGEVKDIFFFRVKKESSKIYNQECCKILLEDLYNEQISVVIFPEALSVLKMLFEAQFPDEKIEKGFGLRISGSTSKYNNETSVIASDIYGIFIPLRHSGKLEQKTLVSRNISKKNKKEITSDDIEDDLFQIIS